MVIESSVAIISLVFLCVVFYGPWQEVCTDYARQVMFEKRDRLFDMAASGKMEFSSPEYREIRISLEKAIRFAHELTLPRFILFRWRLKRINRKRTESSLLDAINSIEDVDIRREVNRLVSDSHISLILMAMAKSPLTVLLFVLVALMIHFVAGFRAWMRRVVRPIAEMVQVEAESVPIRVLRVHEANSAS